MQLEPCAKTAIVPFNYSDIVRFTIAIKWVTVGCYYITLINLFAILVKQSREPTQGVGLHVPISNCTCRFINRNYSILSC